MTTPTNPDALAVVKARELLAAEYRKLRLPGPFDTVGRDAAALSAIEAAIRESVEEAAAIADKFGEHMQGDDPDADRFDRGYETASKSIATAIRALTGKER